MTRHTTTSEKETESLAVKMAAKLISGDVLAFRGGLGAGKTAFVRGLAIGLGIGDVVSSPTFALVHEYGGGPVPFYHFDMYRVEGMDALYSTGFYDYLDGRGILAVEWSENIPGALPENVVTVTIEHIGGDNRLITVEGGGRCLF